LRQSFPFYEKTFAMTIALMAVDAETVVVVVVVGMLF
jgi:hypothetical protein